MLAASAAALAAAELETSGHIEAAIQQYATCAAELEVAAAAQASTTEPEQDNPEEAIKSISLDLQARSPIPDVNPATRVGGRDQSDFGESSAPVDILSSNLTAIHCNGSPSGDAEESTNTACAVEVANTDRDNMRHQEEPPIDEPKAPQGEKEVQCQSDPVEKRVEKELLCPSDAAEKAISEATTASGPPSFADSAALPSGSASSSSTFPSLLQSRTRASTWQATMGERPSRRTQPRIAQWLANAGRRAATNIRTGFQQANYCGGRTRGTRSQDHSEFNLDLPSRVRLDVQMGSPPPALELQYIALSPRHPPEARQT